MKIGRTLLIGVAAALGGVALLDATFKSGIRCGRIDQMQEQTEKELGAIQKLNEANSTSIQALQEESAQQLEDASNRTIQLEEVRRQEDKN